MVSGKRPGRWPLALIAAPFRVLGRIRLPRRKAAPERRVPVAALTRSRRAALWVIAALVAAASLVSFSESYRGLYDWAARHGLSGLWAAIWPVQVDVFIAVGELALFVGLAYAWNRRSRIGAWLVTLAGLAVSVAGNVGHVTSHLFAVRATAAVPPLAAASALAVGLGVLKRVVEHVPAGNVAGEGPPSKQGRDNGQANSPATAFPPDAPSAAEAGMAATVRAGNPFSQNQLRSRFRLTHKEAKDLWRKYEIPPEVAPILKDTPAGVPPENVPAPAGVSNGQVHAHG